MEDRRNIQVLFDAVVPRQIDIYLTSRHWICIDSNDADFQTFEITHKGEQTRVNFLKSKSNPNFRSRLQNLVFTLAVLYEEEPIDIVNAMYDLKPQSSTESSSDTGPDRENPPSRFTICNRFGETLEICCSLWSKPLHIKEHEKLEIVFSPDRFAQPEVSFHQKQIRLLVPESNPVRIFQRQNTKDAPNGIRELVRQCVDQVVDSDAIEELVTQLEPAISRAEFELHDIKVTNDGPRSIMKPIAMLLASLAQRLPMEVQPAETLWSICCSVLARHETLVEICPTAKEELFLLAKQDDENAPRATLDWLTAHSWSYSLDT
ncbi:MAG: hypothetical protein ACI87E_000391 [Mariniblastus sp.]